MLDARASSRRTASGWRAGRTARSATVTTHVPCGDYFEVRDQALLAHATQVDPDGPWFTCPLDLQREVWPTEDFELARSARAAPTPPEDDLFAGIREQRWRPGE